MATSYKALAVLLGITTDNDWPPPERFDPYIHPYRGELVELYLPEKEVASACRKLFPRGSFKNVIGCSYWPERTYGFAPRCTIVVATDSKIASSVAIRRHELGHCNGWPRTHPK